MRSSTPAAWALFAAGAAAQDVTCAKGLYLVVARGTGEPKGSGDMGILAEEVAGRVKDSIIEPLDYPATFTDPLYSDSEIEGVDAMQEIIKSYRSSCADGKIAVMGYSQGGQVATDAFCGGEGGIFSEAKALPTKELADSVVAIVLFGDPSHVAKASYNLGTSKKDGYFAREDVSWCEDNYGDILRSYCDTGDVYCDSGEVRAVHGSYVESYGEEVVDFIVKQYEEAVDKTPSSGDSSSSGGSSGTATTAAATTSSAAPTTSGPATLTTASESASPTSSEPAATAPSDAGNAGAMVMPQLAYGVLLPAVLGALQCLF